jgi:DnaJ-domain-containing protein 1
MEWRETVSEAQQAHNLDEIARVETRLKQDTKALEVQLADKIDVEKDYVSAASVVRKLCFMDKLAEDIRVAYDLMDG